MPGETTTLDFILKETGQEETVVILGSRALPRTQLETPAPVDVIDIKNLSRDAPQVYLNQISELCSAFF